MSIHCCSLVRSESCSLRTVSAAYLSVKNVIILNLLVLILVNLQEVVNLNTVGGGTQELGHKMNFNQTLDFNNVALCSFFLVQCDSCVIEFCGTGKSRDPQEFARLKS